MATQIMWTILLDIDGTLLSTRGAGLRSIQLAVKELFGIEFQLPKVAVHGRTDLGILQDLFQDADFQWQANLTCLLEVYCKHLKENLGRFPGSVMPGVVELLTELRCRQDVAIGLLTGNCELAAQAKMKHFALDHFLDGFGGYGDCSPDRDQVAVMAFNAASAHLRDSFDPERVWVIGDTAADIQCARAIGARVVAVATGGSGIQELTRHDPDVCLADLSQTDRILPRLFA